MDKPLARLTKKRREKKPKVQKSEMKKGFHPGEEDGDSFDWG